MVWPFCPPLSFPDGWAGLAVVGGLSTAIGGVVIAYTGFSGLAMGIIPLAISLLLVWLILVGVRMWRL